MARNLLALKIGISAAAVPALGLCFLAAVHSHNNREHNEQAQKPKKPQMKFEQLGPLRKYATPSGYDVYMFTDPYDPDKHCVATESEYSVYRCYPNAPGVTGRGGVLDMVRFKTPHIYDMRAFVDPENPGLYCIGNSEHSDYTCYEKPKAGKNPQTFQPK